MVLSFTSYSEHCCFFFFRSNSQLQHLPITASQPTQQHKKADNVPSLVRDKTDKLHQYDIVYLDENDAVFSEPPSTITREELGITKPSQAEPLLPLASQMPSVHSQEMPPEDVTDLVQKSVEEAQVMRQQEEALPEEKALMEFFEKVTRNEADFEAELERLLTPKLLELPTEERIEAAFHEQFAPQRFQKAVATLQRYGIEEGMRRLRKTDAEIAGHFERVLPSQSRIDSQRKKD